VRIPGVPAVPAHFGETLKVGCERPLGPPFVRGDAALGFRYLSLQVGGLALLRGAAADPELGDLQSLQGLAILLQLNPVPGDIAVAVSDHGEAVNRMMGREGWVGLVNRKLTAASDQGIVNSDILRSGRWFALSAHYQSGPPPRPFCDLLD